MTLFLMFVPMMEVRHVRMGMRHLLVHVFVRAGFGALVSLMRVLMMLVVNVTMGVNQGVRVHACEHASRGHGCDTNAERQLFSGKNTHARTAWGRYGEFAKS
jgi:hypothetical protein